MFITDQKILNLLNEKDEYAEDNLKIIAEIDSLKKKYEYNIHKLKRIDEKVKPRIVKLVKTIELGEYEELVRVFKKGKEWAMEFSNRLEDWKKAFKKAKNGGK